VQQTAVIPTFPSTLTAWARAAAAAATVSVLAYVLQIVLDYVSAPHVFKFAEFWGLFGGTAVLGCLAGAVAVVQGWKAGRWNATLVCGAIGIGWLVLVQAIQLAWN
jgi:hypothetical protein